MQRKARSHRQSADLNQTKSNPKTRPSHEAFNDGALINPKTDCKYVLCPKDVQHPFSYQYYEGMGYQIVTAEKDGVRIRLGTTPVVGKPLEWKGNVLMSCSLERATEIFLSGPTGNTGQLYYDKLMQQIKQGNLDKRSNLQGLQENYEISDLEQNASPDNGVFRE